MAQLHGEGSLSVGAKLSADAVVIRDLERRSAALSQQAAAGTVDQGEVVVTLKELIAVVKRQAADADAERRMNRYMAGVAAAALVVAITAVTSTWTAASTALVAVTGVVAGVILLLGYLFAVRQDRR